MSMTLTEPARNAMADALVDLLDSGNLEFQNSSNNEVATCGFAATAFGDAAAGTATANAISDDTDAAGGTIDHAHIKQSDSTDLGTLDCTETGGGGDITFPSLVIGAGDTVSVTSLSITVPAS